MTASSEFSNSYKAYYGRLNGTRGDGWCSNIRDSKTDWLQIDIGKVIHVCGVATQGERNGYAYTTDFELSFSADGNSWTPYKDDNNVKVVNIYFAFKGATSQYFESFLRWPKLRLKCWET